MSDLENFVNLYKSFGIDCIINKKENEQVIILSGSGNTDMKETSSSKFDGYGGFYSDVKFDLDGKFISQGFWE